MRRSTIGNLIFAAAVCAAFAATSPADPPHNEQGRSIGTGRMGIPWHVRRPGEPLLWYWARMRWAVSSVPRIQNHDAPAGDVSGPADGPAEPCVNGDC